MSKNFKNIKISIVDDESFSRELTVGIVKENFPDFRVSEADGVATGIKMLKDFEPDIVLLDVEMSDGTGFDLLKSFNDFNFKVIFITAHEEHAIKAIKYSALDYILKPVNSAELTNSVKKAVDALALENEKMKIETLLANIGLSENKNKKLILNTSENVYVVDTADIVRCESDNNYTIFHFLNRPDILMSKTLKEYENILPEDYFIRVHRSHIVNIEYIDKIGKRKSGFVHMKDNSKIPLSPSKKDLLLKKLKA